VPHNLAPVPRGNVETEYEHNEAKQADSTVGPGVILGLLAGKRTDDDDGNGQGSAGWDPHLLRDERGEAHAGVVPHPVHWLGHNGDGHVVKEESQHDTQPQQERDDPVLVMAMYD